MFQKILVPLDGSARSELALPVASRLARASHGTVKLVQVVSPPDKFMVSVGTFVLPDILDENMPAAKAYLENVAKTGELEDIQTSTTVLTGHPAQAIIAEAKADNVDLVVMCSHGSAATLRWSLGSIAEKVARHAPSPVFILHESYPFPAKAGAVSRFRVRVLVPLDGSELAEVTIVPAALLASALAAPTRSELHLTRIVASAEEEEEESNVDEEEVARTEQYLRSVVERWRQRLAKAGVPSKMPITWSVGVAGDPASGILHAAQEHVKGERAKGEEVYQVIAMATHGFGSSNLWATGSTTERVLQTARQPLLIMRR